MTSGIGVRSGWNDENHMAVLANAHTCGYRNWYFDCEYHILVGAKVIWPFSEIIRCLGSHFVMGFVVVWLGFWLIWIISSRLSGELKTVVSFIQFYSLVPLLSLCVVLHIVQDYWFGWF